MAILDPNKKTVNPTLGQNESYVRQYLKDNGFNDDQIGYDSKSKAVLLNGQSFMTPTKNIGGSTVASRADLDSALAGYRNRETSNKIQGLLGQLETNMNKPYEAPQFNYDPQSDPVYQAALSRAQANAATASGNAQAEMNRRGILNSTITGDRLGQIQQAEYGRVSDTVLPQLFQQAYQRYRDTVGDQYQQSRNRITDLANQLGITTGLQDRERAFDQQGWQNRFNYGQATGTFGNGQKTLEKMLADRNYDYQVGRDKVEDQRYQQEFDQRVKQDGLQNAISWYNAKTSRNSSDNAASNAEHNRLMDIWKATGKAPAGIAGVTPGTAWYEGAAKTPEPKPNDIYSEAVTALDGMTPAQRKSFFNGEKAKIIKELGPSGYNTLYNMYFDEYGDPK